MKNNKENLKQIVLIITAFVLIFMGYYNYSFDIVKNNNVALERNEVNLGDVQLVNADVVKVNDTENGRVVSNDELESDNINQTENNDDIRVEKNYFEETRLERTRMYSEILETYQTLIDSSEISQDQKAIAVQEISNISKIKNGIMISENLIKNKGFEDVVILVNDKTASVIVKSYSLNKEQISKIQNIIERELNVEIKNINISNKY